MTAPHETPEQRNRLDELCERHGTLEIVATDRGLVVRADDGAHLTITPNGEVQRR